MKDVGGDGGVKDGESDGAGKEVGVERGRGRGWDRGVHPRRHKDKYEHEAGGAFGMPDAQDKAATSVGSAVDLLTMFLTLFDCRRWS